MRRSPRRCSPSIRRPSAAWWCEAPPDLCATDWMAQTRGLLPLGTRIGRAAPSIADDRLLGGLDLSASLAAGRPVMQSGVLASHDGGVVVLPMAERIEDAMASRICAVLDAQEVAIEREGLTARLPARLGLVLLDEGAEPAERPPAALLDRLAFRNDLNGAPPARRRRRRFRCQ